MTLALDLHETDDPEIELRELGDGRFHFSGYAAVFNAPSNPLPFTETVLPGAFTRTLSTGHEVPLLINHDRTRIPLAVSPGTLRLTEDRKGLAAEADLVPTADAKDLRMHAEAGNARHMSFAFKATPTGSKMDGDKRWLSEVRLQEVSVLIGFAPAYRQTTAYVRSLAHRFDADPDDLTLAIAGLADGTPLTIDQARLIESAVAELRVGEGRHVPIALLRRKMQAARLD
jgi:HK97 family phage prohead protease